MLEESRSRNQPGTDTPKKEPAATNALDSLSDLSSSERSPELDRRTVLRTGVVTGAALTGLGGLGRVGAASSAGEVIWTYGDTELECSPPPETFEAPLTVVDGRVYAGTTCSHMHVIDAASGTEVETIYARATTSTAPNVVNDIVAFTPNNQELTAYNLLEEEARTQTIWQADVGGSVNTFVSAPTVSDGTVYVSNHDGPPYLYALELWSGDEQWTYDEHELGESPIVVDDVVYASGKGGVVVALEADSGTVEWTADIGAESESAGTVADGYVYVGSADNNLYALDAATGDEAWRFETGSSVASIPTVVDGTVYVGSNDGHLYAVDAASGDETWQFETGEFTGSATVADGTVFVGSQGGRLFAIDAASGEEQWQFEETELDDELFPDVTAPTVVDGVVYVASTDGQQGRVHALDAGISGSSEDSRVLLGTAGHHDAWADAAATQNRPDGDESNGTDSSGGTASSSGTDATGNSGDDGGNWGTDDSSSAVQSDDGNGPGFGIASAVAGLGGFGYLLARRAASRGEER